MEKCKTKSHWGRFRHINAHSGIFRHNQTYSGISQAYSSIFRTLFHISIFRTLAYSEPDYIIKPEVCSELCQTSTMQRFAKIVNGYNYFRNINYSHSLLCEIKSTLWNKYEFFQYMFKVGLSPSKKSYAFCFIESPLNIMKNAFYFILKVLFVLKISKFLSWLFGQVGKKAWLER